MFNFFLFDFSILQDQIKIMNDVEESSFKKIKYNDINPRNFAKIHKTYIQRGDRIELMNEKTHILNYWFDGVGFFLG